MFSVLLCIVIGGGLFLLGVGIGALPAFAFAKRIRFEEHIVEIRNNIVGVETILLDGKMVASEFSFGGTYRFPIDDHRAEIRIRYRWHLLGVRTTLRIDDEVYFEE